MTPQYFQADNLRLISECCHAFWGRQGGLCNDSKGRVDDLNTGFLHAEDINEPLKNRELATAQLGTPPPRLVTAKQVHSAIVHTITDPWDNLTAPDGDAIVTNQGDLAVGVITADCGPLLFIDPHNRVIGAAHAGWRGAEQGIVSETVKAMVRLGAKSSSISVALGPCIAQASYEVGPDFPAPFIAKNADYQNLFIPSAKAGHWMFDMKGFILQELKKLDLASVEIMPQDTCADDQTFFSHRFNSLNRLPEFGRQLSAICLTEN